MLIPKISHMSSIRLHVPSLSHPRDLNGGFRSESHSQKAVYDMNRVVDYSRRELEKRL